jgi:hypothetical protein
MKTVVFAVCSGIGYLIAISLPEGPLTAYVPLLVSYHLFLAYLVITENQKVGFSMPVGQTIITHSACLALLVGLAMGRHLVPFFGLIRLLVPGLAPFEADWLFGGRTAPKTEEKAVHTSVAVAAVATDPAADTADEPAPVAVQSREELVEEYDAFQKYLKQARRKFRKPGISVGEEFHLWRADRARERAQS